MADSSGYLHLNVANEWPRFLLHAIEVGKDGAMRLKMKKEAFANTGVFTAGPFEVGAELCAWHRLRVIADPLSEGTHLQLFTFAADDNAAPCDPSTSGPSVFPGWHAAPRDVVDVLIPHPPARRLWLGGLLRCDGQTTPVIHQMRLEYNQEGYLAHLPAIYRESRPQREFLKALLSLHESVLDEAEQHIDRLPALFDPLAAPAEGYPSWLSWLADWLAFDLNEAWDEGETRQHLAEAFRWYGERGTLTGLKHSLKIHAGVEAHVLEPGLHTHLWSLGETSTLGFTTMLAPGHLEGAVLDTTATADQSHLAGPGSQGSALFDDLAHRFCVQIYCAELNRPGALEDVQVVLEREKPAHTSYHLCLIDSTFRVGVQARVGIDAIVGDGPPAARVGMRLGAAALRDGSDKCEGPPRSAVSQSRNTQKET